MRQSVATLLCALGCATLIAACGGERSDETVAADSLDAGERVSLMVPDFGDSLEAEEQEPLVMPDYPEPLRGRLVTRSAGADEIAGEWPARAGSCEDSGTLQLLATGERTGAFLLFYRVPAGDEAFVYPVVPVDSTSPEPPAVRVGVQFLGDRMGDSFQGVEGMVELTALDDHVSGRFAIPLINVETDDTVLYAGVFEQVRVRPSSPLECRLFEESAEPADTLLPADSLD